MPSLRRRPSCSSPDSRGMADRLVPLTLPIPREPAGEVRSDPLRHTHFCVIRLAATSNVSRLVQMRTRIQDRPIQSSDRRGRSESNTTSGVLGLVPFQEHGQYTPELLTSNARVHGQAIPRESSGRDLIRTRPAACPRATFLPTAYRMRSRRALVLAGDRRARHERHCDHQRVVAHGPAAARLGGGTHECDREGCKSPRCSRLPQTSRRVRRASAAAA